MKHRYLAITISCVLAGCKAPTADVGKPSPPAINLLTGSIGIRANTIERPSESEVIATGAPVAQLESGATLSADRISLTSLPNGDRVFSASGRVMVTSSNRQTSLRGGQIRMQMPPEREVTMTTRSTGDALPPLSVHAQARQQRSIRTYKVQRGDTLSSIAQKIYGNSDAWRALYDANRKRIPKVGMRPGLVLLIPKLKTETEEHPESGGR